MTRVFIDTSALFKRYVLEDGTDSLTEILSEADEIAVSAITRIEFHSALKRRLTENSFSIESYQHIIREFHSDMNYFETIPFDLSIETIAIDLIQRLGMKSLDSIQLASAKISNCEMMVVSDRQLFARAESENFCKFRFI